MKSNHFWAAGGKMLAVVTVAIIVVFLLAPGASAAVKYKVLHRFQGEDGAEPVAGSLVFDTAGNLYGMTISGGDYGYGAVFQLVPNTDGNWTENVLHSFTGGSDGSAPDDSSLIIGADGSLYGATPGGGDSGNGVVFELTPSLDGSWSENVLHSFSGGDGAHPDAGLVFDTFGNLYGTATRGGAHNRGVVFELTPNQDGTWSESVLYDFNGHKDGSCPQHTSPIFDPAGNLYGTTSALVPRNQRSTVFQLVPNGDGTWRENVLYVFPGKEGELALGSLAFDPAGNLYGAIVQGGAYGRGMVFKLTPNANGEWKEQVLHQFRGGKDGAAPFGGVVFDTQGNLYGTTLHGSGKSCSGWWGSGCGTVFKLMPTVNGPWTEQILHRFNGKPTGNPYGAVLLDGAGNLYAMTSDQNTDGLGVVFEITP